MAYKVLIGVPTHLWLAVNKCLPLNGLKYVRHGLRPVFISADAV